MSETLRKESVDSKEGNEELATADPLVLRSLKIKMGVVKRLIKDKESYEKEANQQRDKVEECKSKGMDEAVIRNANNCLKETEQLIPDILRRLKQAFNDLKDLMDSERETPVGKSQEYLDAENILQQGKLNLGL